MNEYESQKNYFENLVVSKGKFKKNASLRYTICVMLSLGII